MAAEAAADEPEVVWQPSNGHIERLEVRGVRAGAARPLSGGRTHSARSVGRARPVRAQVNNFKSYRGQQQIGPFKTFTAVVGPNGSGKSNLMDAISFVLGVRTTQLRGSLKELLYQNSEGTSEDDRPQRGYVRLVYCTDEGDKVTFGRHIQPSGADGASFQSVYRINDRTVTWEAYSQKLGSFGILVKVRNFLVFQVRHRGCLLRRGATGCPLA